LQPLGQVSVPVAPIGLRHRLDDAKEAAGFETWESNAVRHSYRSYRLAQCQDAANISLEMGNSPQIGLRPLHGACETEGFGALLED